MEKKYREIEFLCGWNIERAVIELLEYKEKGELVCGEFNDHMLYSDTVTMDNAYLEITGKNKNDFDKAQEEWREKLRIESELDEKAARENIPNWIEKVIRHLQKISGKNGIKLFLLEQKTCITEWN